MKKTKSNQQRFTALKAVTLLVAMVLASAASAGENLVIDDVLAEYQNQGASTFDSKRGQSLWDSETPGAAPFASRSCTSCHGTDLTKAGQHVKTKKVVEPMAASVNAKRYSKQADIEKWFLRNCKWTFGRECSAQEKGDILTFLRSQ